MPSLSETEAELQLMRRAFAPCVPGFVGARIGVAGTVTVIDGRYPLRHGHLDVRAGQARLSIPPSPGLDVAVSRAEADLRRARRLVASPSGSDGPETTDLQVTLDAGKAGRGPLSYRYRWALAHALGPVLHAVFGAPDTLPPPRPGPEPRTAWARTVLDSTRSDGTTVRDWTRGTDRPTDVDLANHVEALRLPVRARGHLELHVAGRQPAGGWLAALVVTATLFADATAARETAAATTLVERPDMPSAWTRAATNGMRDRDLSRAARACLFTAYDGLARQGATRRAREAVARVVDELDRRARTTAA